MTVPSGLEYLKIGAVTRIARAMSFVREHGGPNRGQAVEAMLAAVGLKPGDPWCAAFVSWCGQTALGEEWPLPRVGGCATLGEFAAAKGCLGDLAFYGSVFLLWSEAKNRFNHTGFVLLPAGLGHGAGKVFNTIEGNTSPDGSPEGTGVFQRVRTFGARDKFICWWEIAT